MWLSDRRGLGCDFCDNRLGVASPSHLPAVIGTARLTSSSERRIARKRLSLDVGRSMVITGRKVLGWLRCRLLTGSLRLHRSRWLLEQKNRVELVVGNLRKIESPFLVGHRIVGGEDLAFDFGDEQVVVGCVEDRRGGDVG